jgi:hypothetical protein
VAQGASKGGSCFAVAGSGGVEVRDGGILCSETERHADLELDSGAGGGGPARPLALRSSPMLSAPPPRLAALGRGHDGGAPTVSRWRSRGRVAAHGEF